MSPRLRVYKHAVVKYPLADRHNRLRVYNILLSIVRHKSVLVFIVVACFYNRIIYINYTYIHTHTRHKRMCHGVGIQHNSISIQQRKTMMRFSDDLS